MWLENMLVASEGVEKIPVGIVRDELRLYRRWTGVLSFLFKFTLARGERRHCHSNERRR